MLVIRPQEPQTGIRPQEPATAADILSAPSSQGGRSFGESEAYTGPPALAAGGTGGANGGFAEDQQVVDLLAPTHEDPGGPRHVRRR